MDTTELKGLLKSVATGTVAPELAFEILKTSTYTDIEFAKVDTYRKLRQGIPEVIFGPGKTALQIAKIAAVLLQHHNIVVAAKVEPSVASEVLATMQAGRYDETARMLVFGELPATKVSDNVCVVTAGTADVPVAEEAALYLAASGITVQKIFDVGVAGIHRLFPHLQRLRECTAVIVIAGMDGALASVIGGLTDVPVIAVPTSVGYGASYLGLSALLAMLNSCAAGLTVVNIDNGFGAAVAALRIIGKKSDSGSMADK
ncbi:MAG TPA: nickel pincer cofactor biosynthesis protein LarB [Oculatellaceae cyanobacterium]